LTVAFAALYAYPIDGNAETGISQESCSDDLPRLFGRHDHSIRGCRSDFRPMPSDIRPCADHLDVERLRRSAPYLIGGL
jgi:hypothetical protein